MQIYDKIFKRIITLSKPAIIRFINSMFEKNFDLDSEITYNWTESVDDALNKIIADTIITIDNDFKFHIEVQIANDSSIALRMFEYEFKEAIKYKTTDNNKITLNLPEAKIIYLEHTETTPDFVELAFNFQGQSAFEYKVKTEKLLNYTVEELDKSGLVILMPLYILKLRKKIQSSYKINSKELALELKKLLDNCIISIENNEHQGNISYDDAVILINLLDKLYRQLYNDYKVFNEEGVDSMLAEKLELYTEVREQQAKLEALKEVALRLIKNGNQIEEIEKLTGLPKSEILVLKNN